MSVVRASGHLGGDTSSDLHRVLSDELGRSPMQLVVELSDVTSTDGAAVHALSAASAIAGESDIALSLIAPSAGPVVESLAAADVIERFEIFSVIDETVDHRSLSELRNVCDGDSPNA
ncbi:anti-sigma factor antagonist [Mycolicibacterium madagascariense]|uniref:anti-sigma factor antagonist n=1 Tax=Mycolicibacterium madagascariense TaxID=212765 RepID=UPI003557C8DF